MSIRIDLVSDTVTRPDAAMLAAMASAELGDEQREGDPTSNRLCREVAGMLGKEAAIFLPSGTMCNLVAASVHCRPGEVIIADRGAHVITSELGGIAAVSGALALTIEATRGQFPFATVEAAINGLSGGRAPRARLVWVEQTHNRGGGSVWPIEALGELARACQARGLASHMDGARLLNAAVASGAPPAQHAAEFDSVWIDFSKGLGCPTGAVLAGTRGFITEAEVWKRRLGGALRQSGILAAAALHALDGYEERLARDHALATALADRLRQVPGLAVLKGPVETNLVFIDVSQSGIDAHHLSAQLLQQGIRVGVESCTELRLVTHAAVTRSGIDEAAALIACFTSAHA
jgi:threonine aldolase